MCDYSLMCYPNRLAVKGEELVVHRFPSGSKGLASAADLPAHRGGLLPRSFWAELKDFFSGPHVSAIPAVCIPPAGRLVLHDLSDDFRRQHGLCSEELVTFRQLSAESNTYRDAVVFRNQWQVRLQDLPLGLRVTVFDLPKESSLSGTEQDRTAVEVLT